MANSIDRIGRDLGTPFDPNNALEVRDWNDWTIPPTSGVLDADLRARTPNSRAIRMLDPNLVPALGPATVPDPENPLGPGLPILPTPDRVNADRFFDRRGLGCGSMLRWPEPIWWNTLMAT